MKNLPVVILLPILWISTTETSRAAEQKSFLNRCFSGFGRFFSSPKPLLDMPFTPEDVSRAKKLLHGRNYGTEVKVEIGRGLPEKSKHDDLDIEFQNAFAVQYPHPWKKAEEGKDLVVQYKKGNTQSSVQSKLIQSAELPAAEQEAARILRSPENITARKTILVINGKDNTYLFGPFDQTLNTEHLHTEVYPRIKDVMKKEGKVDSVSFVYSQPQPNAMPVSPEYSWTASLVYSNRISKPGQPPNPLLFTNGINMVSVSTAPADPFVFRTVTYRP